jgi:hypothetical protein
MEKTRCGSVIHPHPTQTLGAIATPDYQYSAPSRGWSDHSQSQHACIIDHYDMPIKIPLFSQVCPSFLNPVRYLNAVEQSDYSTMFQFLRKPADVPGSAVPAIIVGLFVSFGGILFGYDTGTISGILAMK